MQNDKDTEIKTKYDNYSVDELKAALKNYFFFSGEFSEADMEEMNQIMAVLDRKEPISSLYTAEESLMRFQETYDEELSSLGVRKTEEVIKEKPAADSETVCSISRAEPVRTVRRRRLLRAALVAAAVVVILIAAAATASALGYTLFGWVPKWNSDVLGFGEDESPKPNELHDTYKIPTALKELGIEEPLYPTWLPDGFKIDVSVIETDPVFMHEGYSDGDRYLSITIEPSSSTEKGMYQKDDIVPYEYCVKEHTHFIFSDVEQLTATWNTGGYGVLLVGNVSLEEMKKMIDSVYEVKK